MPTATGQVITQWNVDGSSDCDVQTGAFGCASGITGPFHTVGFAVRNIFVHPGDTLKIKAGVYPEPMVIYQPLTLRSYDGQVTIGPTSLWPFDLVSQGVDPNGLPLDPKWGQQITAPGSLPDFDGGCRASIHNCCLDATCGSDCHLEYDNVPGCTHQPIFVEKGSLCPRTENFGIGHVNWFPCTYVGTNFWVGHSCPACDDDYQFMLQTVNGGGYANPDSRDEIPKGYPTIECTNLNCYAIECEFDSSETIDQFDARIYNDYGSLNWWNFFHIEVDADGCAGCIHADGTILGDNGPYPRGYYATHFLNNGQPAFAIVTGLMSLDCVHSCNSELHPVFAMAMNAAPSGVLGYGAKLDDADDLWVFFVRNSGNQGYCGSSSPHYLQLPNNIYKVMLPWKKDSLNRDMKSVEVCESWHASNTQRPKPTWEANPGIGILVTFWLDPPRDNGSMWDGQLELRWTPQ
jgi:hypothetical protein